MIDMIIILHCLGDFVAMHEIFSDRVSAKIEYSFQRSHIIYKRYGSMKIVSTLYKNLYEVHEMNDAINKNLTFSFETAAVIPVL